MLLRKLRHVHAGGNEENYLVPDEALKAFMEHCSSQVGDQYFRTPRETVKKFVQLLAILYQNPEASWRELIEDVDLEEDRGDPIWSR